MNKADLKFLRKAAFNIAFWSTIGKELGKFVTRRTKISIEILRKNEEPESTKTGE